ncbi:hypothetical protein [Streptomyces sp. NPDC001070]
MRQENENALATRLARRAVEATAPEELPQFAMTASAFHRASPRNRLLVDERDEPLGIGLEAITALISTGALAAAVKVLDNLTDRWTDRAIDVVQRRFVPRLRRRGAEITTADVAAMRLSAEQLTQVRRVAVETAMRMRVPEAQARSIADGIVAELVTLASGTPSPGEGTPSDGE